MQRLISPGVAQVIVATIIQAVSASTVFMAYSVIAVSLQSEFEPSRMVLMLGITAVSLVSGITSPLLGKAIDQYSLRGLMFTGAGMLSLGVFLLSTTQSMVQVIAVYAIFLSLGVVLLGPMAASSLLVRWFHRKRGMMIGIAGAGVAFGGLIIPPLLQWLIGEFGWRTALQIFSVIVFFLTVPVIAFLAINRPSDRGLLIDGGTEDSIQEGDDNQGSTQQDSAQQDSAQQENNAPATAPLTTARLIRHPTFWCIAVLLSMVFGGSTAITSNLMPLVMDKGVEATQGAFLLSILAAAGFFGKLACASIVDRLQSKIVFSVIIAGTGMSVVGFLVADFYLVLALATFSIGFFTGGASPLWSVLLAKIYGPENFGRVMGLMTPILMPGTLLGPPLFGFVYDRSGSYDYAFTGLIVLLLIGIAVLLPGIKERSFFAEHTDSKP